MANMHIISLKKILKSSTPDYGADSRRAGDPDGVLLCFQSSECSHSRSPARMDFLVI